jgi:hypothetical protein
MTKDGFASWNRKHKDSRLTLRVEKERLTVEQYNICRDGQPNYLFRYEFKER